MAAQAFAAILGGLLGGGGQVAGGLLGGASGGQAATSLFNPSLDLALQASQFAALDPLGFGSVSSLPGPRQQLINQFNASGIQRKTREKAVGALDAVRRNPEILSDPGGYGFSLDDAVGFLDGNSPEGRELSTRAQNISRAAQNLDRRLADPNLSSRQRKLLEADRAELEARFGTLSDPVRLGNKATLSKILKQQGLNISDVQRIFDQQAQFDAQIKQLEDAGLGGIQVDTILNRSNAAKTASELLGGAADFARTGQPGNPLSQTLFDRDERLLGDLQDRLGVLANFGGINQSQLFDSLTDAKLDQNLRLIEQQLGISNALQTTLNPSSAAAANVAAQQAGTSLNSAQLAAQQAIAAGQLRQAGEMNRGTSLGNGVGTGSSSVGSGFSTGLSGA